METGLGRQERELRSSVYGYWAARLGTPAAAIDQPGTLVEAAEGWRGKTNFTLYRYGNRSLIRACETRLDRLTCAVSAMGADQAITKEMLLAYFETAVEPYLAGEDTFVEPDAFQPVGVPAPFSLRQVDGFSEPDATVLATFFAACSDNDLEEADIWLEKPDPVIFGIFDGQQMIAYASHRPEEVYPTVGDVGVLIHPDYRGRGLGRAVVSADVSWCHQHGVVPMYRYDKANRISARLAQALGFQPWLQIDILSFTS